MWLERGAVISGDDEDEDAMAMARKRGKVVEQAGGEERAIRMATIGCGKRVEVGKSQSGEPEQEGRGTGV